MALEWLSGQHNTTVGWAPALRNGNSSEVNLSPMKMSKSSVQRSTAWRDPEELAAFEEQILRARVEGELFFLHFTASQPTAPPSSPLKKQNRLLPMAISLSPRQLPLSSQRKLEAREMMRSIDSPSSIKIRGNGRRDPAEEETGGIDIKKRLVFGGEPTGSPTLSPTLPRRPLPSASSYSSSPLKDLPRRLFSEPSSFTSPSNSPLPRLPAALGSPPTAPQLPLQLHPAPPPVPSSRPDLDVVIGRYLNDGLLEEAAKICTLFGHRSEDVVLTSALVALASGDLAAPFLDSEVLALLPSNVRLIFSLLLTTLALGEPLLPRRSASNHCRCLCACQGCFPPLLALSHSRLIALRRSGPCPV